jgi:hypothetical protein
VERNPEHDKKPVYEEWHEEQTIEPELAEKVRACLESQTWVFAKTMPWIPHFYTLRRNWSNESQFVRVVEVMRLYGKDEYYGKARRRSRVLILGGFKYWTMESPISDTILINRKPWPPNGTTVSG